MKHGAAALLAVFLVFGPRVSAQDALSSRYGIEIPSGAAIIPSQEGAALAPGAGGPQLEAGPGVFMDSPSLDGSNTGTQDMAVRADTVQADSLRRAMVRRLLPDHLSLVERGLWGESGLLRTTGIAGPLTPESRKNELSVRRGMLTVHQLGGLVTLGLMGTTVYFGQMTLDHPQTRSYRNTHGNFVSATIIAYSLTGALAILSPPPLIRRDEVSTTSIHKTLAWVHVAGMILTPILGASLRHSMSYDQLARFHQISGYITTATFAAAMIVVTF